MNLTVRNLRHEDDYWHIRDFIRQVFLLNGRREMKWVDPLLGERV